MYSAPSQYRQAPLSSTKSRNEKNKFDKNNTSMLVTMRERKKGVRDSIEKCLIHVEKHPVAEQGGGFNSLSELVVVCLESLEEMKVMQGCGSSNNNHREGGEEEHRLDQYLERQNDHRAWLVTLLCAYPETFHAILDIIGESRVHHTDQSRNPGRAECCMLRLMRCTALRCSADLLLPPFIRLSFTSISEQVCPCHEWEVAVVVGVGGAEHCESGNYREHRQFWQHIMAERGIRRQQC